MATLWHKNVLLLHTLRTKAPPGWQGFNIIIW